MQGLDLSPYFLAVAQYKEKKRSERKNPISWIHANGENTGLPSKSFDLVSIAYVVCCLAHYKDKSHSLQDRISFASFPALSIRLVANSLDNILFFPALWYL